MQKVKLSLAEAISFIKGNFNLMENTMVQLSLDTYDYWLGWIELALKYEKGVVHLTNQAIEISLEECYAEQLGCQKLFHPIYPNIPWLKGLSTAYSFLPRKLMPDTFIYQFSDYGVYTNDIINMDKSKRLKKRRSVANRYESDRYELITYGEHSESLLREMICSWCLDKRSRSQDLLDDYIYDHFASTSKLESLPYELKGLVVLDKESGKYAAWSGGMHLTPNRWSNLIRLVSDSKKYPGLADFIYRRTAMLFANYKEESDGMAGYGLDKGAAFFKSSYASPELMREYVKPC